MGTHDGRDARLSLDPDGNVLDPGSTAPLDLVDDGRAPARPGRRALRRPLYAALGVGA